MKAKEQPLPRVARSRNRQNRKTIFMTARSRMTIFMNAWRKWKRMMKKKKWSQIQGQRLEIVTSAKVY